LLAVTKKIERHPGPKLLLHGFDALFQIASHCSLCLRKNVRTVSELVDSLKADNNAHLGTTFPVKQGRPTPISFVTQASGEYPSTVMRALAAIFLPTSSLAQCIHLLVTSSLENAIISISSYVSDFANVAAHYGLQDASAQQLPSSGGVAIRSYLLAYIQYRLSDCRECRRYDDQLILSHRRFLILP
jgi:hypothetical protein